MIGWKTKRSSDKAMAIAIYDILSEIHDNKYFEEKVNDLIIKIIELTKRDL
jgi:hypothetical protein